MVLSQNPKHSTSLTLFSPMISHNLKISILINRYFSMFNLSAKIAKLFSMQSNEYSLNSYLKIY